MGMEKTILKRIEQYRDRWSSFGSGTGITHLSDKLSASELQKLEIFQDYPEKFLEQISPDVSVASWKKNAVLFEEGSYIDVAFCVIKGEVAVYLNKLKGEGTQIQPIFAPDQTIAQLAGPSEAAPPSPGETVYYERSQKLRTSSTLTFLSTMDFDLPRGDMVKLGEGEIFGEIGALNGWPMSITAQTLSDCELVQIRVPALRKMKRKSEAFKKRIDALYRERALLAQLKASPLFRSCADNFLADLAASVDLISCEPDEAVVAEGQPADALFLVRSGFLKLSQQVSQGQRAISYLSKGMTFGEIELLIEDIENFRLTASSVGYSELVRISAQDFRRVLKTYPEIEAEMWNYAIARIKERGSSRRDPQQSEFIQFSLDKGLVEGNSILVIDLNSCTRCDDCVRACAETHGGRPRFVREGDKYDNLLIAKACYHCQDPVCLIGCPTGAIRRANVGEVVEIDEDICIGCSNCANNCPYDAIVMHDTGTKWGADALPKALRGEDRMLASKCDLCYESELGPACVRNCPHDCAFRVGSIEEFQELLKR